MNLTADHSVKSEPTEKLQCVPTTDITAKAGCSFQKGIPDFTFDFPNPVKPSSVTEKFILDLLSLQETSPTAEKQNATVSTVPISCDTDDLTRDTTDMSRNLSVGDSVSPVSVNEPLVLEISGLDELRKLDSSRADDSLMGESQMGQEDVEDLCAKLKRDTKEPEDVDIRTSSSLSTPVFRDGRTKRRREFHKIHTRRSRAKLNEKMDLLKRILPEPPAGIVVKSKAQIIDYAIRVLARLPLDEIDMDKLVAQRT